MYEWMDEWMDGWMDGWMYGLKLGWNDGWTDGWICLRMYGPIIRFMVISFDGSKVCFTSFDVD